MGGWERERTREREGELEGEVLNFLVLNHPF
jgi:hypothetical protein